MARFYPAASFALSLMILVLISAPCEGKPQHPDFSSYFTSETSIRVEWGLPTLDPGASVRGYKLQHKLGENGEVVKLKLGGVSSYDIEGLTEPCGDYRIKMSTISSKGSSRYSSFGQVDRALSAPQNLVANPSGSSARLNWGPPPNTVCFDSYLLKYGRNENELRDMTLPGDLNNYLLTELQSGTSYFVTLSAVAGEEIGDEAIVQFYQAGPPSSPTNLKANPTSTESAIVMWAPTSSGVTGYQYLYGSAGNPDSKLTSGHVETTMVELSGLDPGEEYIIKVSSVNAIGESAAASVTWTQPQPVPEISPSKPLPTAPGEVTVDINSAETVLVTWTRPEGDVDISGFIVGFGLSGSSAGDFSYFSVDPSELETELDGLKPGSTYVVNVQAYNDIGDGDITSVEWQQEPPEVPLSIPSPLQDVLTYSSTPTNIVVRWTLPEDAAFEQLEGVRVTYGQTVAADEFTQNVPPDQGMFIIENLNPETFYYMKLYKYNAAGQSLSVSRSLETLSPPPEERCAQKQQCIQQFQMQNQSRGSRDVCSHILQYMNCLQRLREDCMENDNYRDLVGGVQRMHISEGCNRNPRIPNGPQPPHVPSGGFAATPSETLPGEIIPSPTNLEATVLSSSSASISWVDTTLEADNRFYILRYRSPHDREFLEVRTPETSYVADFLLPGVRYEFEVQLVLGPQRRSEPSEPLFVTARNPAQGALPERFTVTQVVVTSPNRAKAILNWLPPPERKDVMEYRIEYTDSEEFRNPATVWDQITVDGSKMSAVIEGLPPNQEYHARITAIFSRGEIGPSMASPSAFATPVVPPSSQTTRQCDENEVDATTRRVNFLWDEVVDGVQRPPLFGIPIPYCEEEFGVEECHGIFCFCIPGSRPPALREPQCATNVPPCRRERNAARQALDEARQSGIPAMGAQLPYCRDDGYYQPMQCSGTMCYCVTENGEHTGRESPLWEVSRLRCA